LILDRRQIRNTDNTVSKHNPEKASKAIAAKQHYPGLVTSYDTRPGNEVSLFYNAPEPTQSTTR